MGSQRIKFLFPQMSQNKSELTTPSFHQVPGNMMPGQNKPSWDWRDCIQNHLCTHEIPQPIQINEARSSLIYGSQKTRLMTWAHHETVWNILEQEYRWKITHGAFLGRTALESEVTPFPIIGAVFFLFKIITISL